MRVSLECPVHSRHVWCPASTRPWHSLGLSAQRPQREAPQKEDPQRPDTARLQSRGQGGRQGRCRDKTGKARNAPRGNYDFIVLVFNIEVFQIKFS